MSCYEAGVSPWIDSLSREMLETGELARLMKEDAVVGVTSNPTIFQKAISTGDWYDEQLGERAEDRGRPDRDLPPARDGGHPRACDLLRPVWDAAGGDDGYVSLEVDPTLAYDREATFEQAIRLHEEVDRPNLFVKIPATKPGLAAIEDCIARGKSINVTLIFSLERYAAVVEAYIRGLERLVAGGGDPTNVASVASFFVSRVDTEADKRLDELGGQATSCRASSRSRTRSSPTGTARRRSPARAGRASPPRARRRSAASGRRRRRRTPSTATCCTSRS